MVFTRLEKVIFVALILLLGLGSLLLIGKVGTIRQQNYQLLMKIDNLAALTDSTVLVKGDGFNAAENALKLNLNRTNLNSIKSLPDMSSALAERVYEYIKEKGEIKDLSELMNVKGMTIKKIRQLEISVTVVGGHSGQAAWGDKLNLNFASAEDISALPGIGKKMAEKIVDFRDRNGGFFSLDDLKEVPGVTDKTMKKLKDLVEVR